MSNLPFVEEKLEDGFIRTFSANVEDHELQWHYDKEDRTILVMQETNWLFQRDNCLPEPFIHTLEIKAGEYHRILKGDGDLIVKIIKKDQNGVQKFF